MSSPLSKEERRALRKALAEWGGQSPGGPLPLETILVEKETDTKTAKVVLAGTNGWKADFAYEDDAAICAAAVNALPALLDLADERDKLVEHIREANENAPYALVDALDSLADRTVERDNLIRERDRLARCLGFFASVIKSGEPWTEDCQREYDLARARGEEPDDAGVP